MIEFEAYAAFDDESDSYAMKVLQQIQDPRGIPGVQQVQRIHVLSSFLMKGVIRCLLMRSCLMGLHILTENFVKHGSKGVCGKEDCTSLGVALHQFEITFLVDVSRFMVVCGCHRHRHHPYQREASKLLKSK